jgi:Predicted transcriptional regulators
MESKKEFFLIGEASAMCGIPIKTLRYYDEIGLLKPEKVDMQNNYRYYSRQQILYISIIKDLKSSGFSLKDIQVLLKRDNLHILESSLLSKYNEITRKIEELKHLQIKLEKHIKALNHGGSIGYYNDNGDNQDSYAKIEVKNIPVFPVAYTRYRCSCNPNAFIERYSQLQNIINEYNMFRVGPFMAVFHDHYTKFSYDEADIEVCIPVVPNTCPEQIVRNFGGFTAVTALHRGSYSRMIDTYKAAMDWIDGNGYTYTGPAAENYIIDAASTKYEDYYVTEIILPVKKK